LSDLQGRVALVTGAGRGIGRAIALRLALAGASVAIAARSSDELEETAAEMRKHGPKVMVRRCDVTDGSQVEDLVQAVREMLGPALILVNNAGSAASAKLVDTSDEIWDGLMRVNATATFYCMRALLPDMLQAGWGRIVNIASIAGRIGAAYISAYSASKHAVMGLTRSAAAEVGDKGITVNAICPGYVDTPMTDASVAYISMRTGRTAEAARSILEQVSPQKRLMTADEVATLALFLCSDEARGINGQGIVLDGGSVQA
jgi:3-hydroxybutyrate dehydrogenase